MKQTSKFAVFALTAALYSSTTIAQTLVFCSEGSPEGFDPALYTSGTTFDASAKAVFDQLVLFKSGTTETMPGLAERWEVSDDGKVYTFHLRQGVKFHATGDFKPTRDFNADDVIFSFDRQSNPDNPYYDYSGGSWEYFNAMDMGKLIERIERVDDQTVRFHLRSPEAPFIANLAMPFASILSKEFADHLIKVGTPELINQTPIGTGPFRFEAYQKDAVIRYRSNADYWRGASQIDNLIFAITPDAAVRYQKLKAGECQAMPYPNPADLPAMKANPKITLLSQEGLNVGYLAYNALTAPFDNPKVRKALNMAINKQAIIEVIFQGAGKVAKNPLPPTMWGYNDAIEDDPYDPDAARKMLEEAGVKDLHTKIWAMPVQRPYNPNARRMAEMIQEDWRKIGVMADIVSYEWGEYLERSKEKDREGALLMGWTGDNGDPDNFLSVLLSCEGVGGSNRSQWCNEEFNQLIRKARTVSARAERIKLYEQAQAIFKEQAPWATIAHSVIYEPISKQVKGYQIDPFGLHDFYEVSIGD